MQKAAGAMEKVQWFGCPGCDRIVTGMVRDDGPKNAECMSRSHCCIKCEQGLGHDDWWCSGTPGAVFREIKLPQSRARGEGTSSDEGEGAVEAHYILHQPDWDAVKGPVPALLFLHGGLTYVWPETLHAEIERLVEGNPLAKDFVIVAPLASKGEPLAIRSKTRTVQDRFEKEVLYVDNFEKDLTWECFWGACKALGPDRVDFTRMCVTGFSMGAQATWDQALARGSLLSAIAPMAGCCLWTSDHWNKEKEMLAEIRRVPIKSFSIESDIWSYNIKDFEWLGGRRGTAARHQKTVLKLSSAQCGWVGVETIYHSWGNLAQLGLIRGFREGHNCWDLVYKTEHVFHLFEWMAAMRNVRLATVGDEPVGVSPGDEESDTAEDVN